MNKKIFFSNLSDILEAKVSEKDLTKKLEKYDWDSLKVLELMSFSDTYFEKLNINPDQINKCVNIKDIYNLFSKHIK